MKITLGTFVLAGRVPEEAPRDLRIEPDGQVQTAGFVRAAAGRAWNRGNVVTRISFTVARQHTDVRAAQNFLLDHELDCPGDGLLTCTSSAEGAESVRYLPDAVLQRPKGHHTGATTFHDYVVLGGRLTRQKP
ncbi:hypothetical protein HUU05_09670 [candidate division KSB1 bacterium]|nr:hypothetical protein [candidate division KSB1 bacterium]